MTFIVQKKYFILFFTLVICHKIDLKTVDLKIFSMENENFVIKNTIFPLTNSIFSLLRQKPAIKMRRIVSVGSYKAFEFDNSLSY